MAKALEIAVEEMQVVRPRIVRAPGDGILVEVFVRYFGQVVQNRRRRVEIRVTLGKIDGTVLSADAGHAADNGIGKMFRAGG